MGAWFIFRRAISRTLTQIFVSPKGLCRRPFRPNSRTPTARMQRAVFSGICGQYQRHGDDQESRFTNCALVPKGRHKRAAYGCCSSAYHISAVARGLRS